MGALFALAGFQFQSSQQHLELYRARQRFDCPIAAYNISGEYMMLNSAAQAGLLYKEKAMLETLYSIKRAGADIIITYFAKDVAMGKCAF